jgi:hypothetical protein
MSSLFGLASRKPARATRDATDVALLEQIKAVHATHDGTAAADRRSRPRPILPPSARTTATDQDRRPALIVGPNPAAQRLRG